jgi:hypothetical protein
MKRMKVVMVVHFDDTAGYANSQIGIDIGGGQMESITSRVH